MTGLSITEGSSSSVSSISSFSLFVLIFLSMLSDLLSSLELSSMIAVYDPLLSVEQTCDRVLSAMISFYLLSYESQTYEIEICCMTVIYVLTGST